MWNFTADGFVSVVKYDLAKAGTKQSKHGTIVAESGRDDWLILRARVKGDLVRIAEYLDKRGRTGEDALEAINYEHLPSADYSHRALVTKDEYKAFMAHLIDDIDYDSHFKEISRDRAPESRGRYRAMMSVWSSMAELQDTAPYSGHRSV